MGQKCCTADCMGVAPKETVYTGMPDAGTPNHPHASANARATPTAGERDQHAAQQQKLSLNLEPHHHAAQPMSNVTIEEATPHHKDHQATSTRQDGGVCEGDINGHKGKIRYVNGDVYEGEWRQGRAHGQGKITRHDGSMYEGEWVEDVAHGHGREVYPDGSEYIGAYRNGVKNGRGAFRWPNGTEYTGEFKDNAFDGWGLYKWNDGRVYKGQWSANRFHGYGVMTWVDGRRYEGQYKDDKKAGVGTFVWSDGRKHVGLWVDGKQHGVGVFTTSNGFSRKGNWADGTRTEWLGDPVPEAKIADITPPELRFTPPAVPEETFINERPHTHAAKNAKAEGPYMPHLAKSMQPEPNA